MTDQENDGQEPEDLKQKTEAEAGEAEGQQQQDTGEQGPDPEVESRARRMGWRPKDEFSGPDERWIDAETYVKRGEEIQPILKANLRKAEDRLAELEKTLKEFAGHHTKTEQRMYAKAMKDLTDKQRKAAEEGDVAAFDKVEAEKQELLKDATGGTRAQATVDPVARQWADDNRWFREDQELALWATSHHEFLRRSKPGLTLEENLEEVTKAVKKAFPEKFTNPRRNGHSPVEGNTAPRGRGGKGYSDLPAEAKQACDRFVKQGLMSKEQYLKDFFAE